MAACAVGAAVALGGDPLVPSTPRVPAGFDIAQVATFHGARELAVTPNGDLIAGTSGSNVAIVPDAEGSPGPPAVFAHLDDGVAAGVVLGPGALYVGTNHGVWRIPYRPGDRRASAAPQRIASVRSGDDGGHSTTSLAIAGSTLYVSVGSSCNACTETDPTRAKILEMPLAGGPLTPKAENIRNAIALAVDPQSGDLWAGVAGQDELEHGHPYEIFDDVSSHAGVADYGWPVCYEDRRAVTPGTDCGRMVVSRVVFPAYETPIGATFYPADQSGAHAFPARYRGGAFVTLHGSWHLPHVAPQVVFVPLDHDRPTAPVDWSDPSKQWLPFVTGYQNAAGGRSGRPTGVAVGTDGSLFVADDDAAAVYRVRPR